MAQSREEIEHNQESLNQFKMDWFSLAGKVAIISVGTLVWAKVMRLRWLKLVLTYLSRLLVKKVGMIRGH